MQLTLQIVITDESGVSRTEELMALQRSLGRQSFLHGSETLRIHRQINNDAACGRFGDFALR
ncbi:hypothetical protein DIL38_23075 [Salmonella enterica]|nr:hypothetical protein [Salmonella enterica]